VDTMRLVTKAEYSRRLGVSWQALTRFVWDWRIQTDGPRSSSTPRSSTAPTAPASTPGGGRRRPPRSRWHRRSRAPPRAWGSDQGGPRASARLGGRSRTSEQARIAVLRHAEIRVREVRMVGLLIEFYQWRCPPPRRALRRH